MPVRRHLERCLTSSLARACSTASLLAALAWCGRAARAQDCLSLQPAPFAGWIGADWFSAVGLPTRDILDAIVHDFDGPGPQSPRLIVTGVFDRIGGIRARGVAAYDGERWMPLDNGLAADFGLGMQPGGSSLAIHRGELYIGGEFASTSSTVGGSQEKYLGGLARWNGMTFEPLFRSTQSLPGFSLGTVNSVVSAHGVLYLSGATVNFGTGANRLVRGGMLTEAGLRPLAIPPALDMASIAQIGDEIFYSSGNGITGWNGRTARTLPYPPGVDGGAFFPHCAIEDAGSIIFGGVLSPSNAAPTSHGTSRWSDEWSAVPNLPIPANPGAGRITMVDSFIRRDGNLFAFTWPFSTTSPPMQRLVNGQWVDEPIHYGGFTTQNNHIRGEVMLGNRRFLYGKINAPFTGGRITFSNPANLIAEVDASNTVIPMRGLYNAADGSWTNTNRPGVIFENQLVLGGPIGFSEGGQRILYTAGWDGTRWNRVVNVDPADPPVDLIVHNGQLYGLARLSSTATGWQLLQRDASRNWVPVASQTFTGLGGLVSHLGDLYVLTGSQSTNVFRLTGTTLAPLPAHTVSSVSGLVSRVSAGGSLYVGGTTLQRFTGTSWQTIPLTGGPSDANVLLELDGALHAVDSIGNTTTDRVTRLHRLTGTTWSLVSSTQPGSGVGPVTGANVIDGSLYIAGTFGVLRLDAGGAWARYAWPIALSSSSAMRILKGPEDRILITGALGTVGSDPSVNIAMLAPTTITINWPPLPRAGTRNSVITIGVGAVGQSNNNTGLAYQWLREGVPLVNGPTPAGTTIGGATSRRLVLSNAQTADAGMFSVRISLACGTSVTTDPVPITISACNDIDFNNNGVFAEDQDVIDFFHVLAGGTCSIGNICDTIDFNNNTVFPEEQDMIDFLHVLAGGSCD